MCPKRRESEKSAPPRSRPSAAVIDPTSQREGHSQVAAASTLTTAQWDNLRKKILEDHRASPPKDPFGSSASRGAVYRWGWATATRMPCDDSIKWLSRLAAGVNEKGFRIRKAEAIDQAVRFQESLPGGHGDVLDASRATVWAAALPGLLRYLPEHDWWSLLGGLQEFRDRQLQRETTGAMALVAVAEMGLTLAHHLRALPSCRRLKTSSLEMLARWCDRENLAVSEAVGRTDEFRLILASAWRTRRLLDAVDPISKSGKKKTKQAQQSLRDSLDEIIAECATWAAAMTRSGGQNAFSSLAAADVRDDSASDGLLMSIGQLGAASSLPAIQAALGVRNTRGRLAWQVGLPESLLNDEDAGFACLLPEWDVRRGRVVVGYDRRQMRIEMVAGKNALISGVCETHVAIDGKTAEPSSDLWVTTCEYTDDDVHYLELEQPLAGNVLLQRQIMLLREDRCCLLADAIVESSQPGVPKSDRGQTSAGNGAPHRKLSYQLRLPLGQNINVTDEPDTTELWLGDQRRRALIVPLSANEWRGALSTTRLEATADRHLLVQARGEGQLFVPLWFDLSRSRFNSPRTWRQLTVGESLNEVSAARATAYRIQLGHWQWVVYRSLSASGPRTFFGKQMIADFYCARFDADSQTYEDLITVEGDST